MSDGAQRPRPRRVAVISLHTSPQDQPGTGDAGGMNVYILSVARRLAEQGIAVDVFTRRTDPAAPSVAEISPGSRLLQVPAGPPEPLAKGSLPAVVPEFVRGMVTHASIDDPSDAHRHSPYDVVHSHYWLSGWVGERTKQIWGVPHVASFHTLGGVKNAAMDPADPPEPAVRLEGERRVAGRADRLLSPTPVEAADLVSMYGADPGRIRVIPPGVDRGVFVPRARREARDRLGLGAGPIALFVGRIQPFKGPDVAIRAVALAARDSSAVAGDLRLLIVGGDVRTGPGVEALRRLAASLGIADRVTFLPPRPHPRLADLYSSADVVLMPSRSESFGLVALEAQACGTPVIASRSGGLVHAVADGESGFLVPPNDVAAFAGRIVAVLANPGLRDRLSAGAVRQAARFSWDATVERIRAVYGEVAGGRAA